MVHIYDVRSGSEEPLESFALHSSPVAVMRYNAAHDTVISIDQKGIVPSLGNVICLVFPGHGRAHGAPCHELGEEAEGSRQRPTVACIAEIMRAMMSQAHM